MRSIIPAVIVALAFITAGCREKPATHYYYPADLKARSLPAWSPTNELPVSPSEAVSVALKHLSLKSGDSPWIIESIELSPIEWTDPVTWEYSIRLSQIGRAHV